MALPVGCSRCGDTRLRRRAGGKAPGFVPIQIALPRAVLRRLASRTALRRRGRGCWRWRRRRQAVRGDRDRGERGAHPGRAGSGAGDAFDGAVGAARRPVIALRADLKVVMAAQPVDFRKSVHTLSALVSEALRANPYCGDVFVFRSQAHGQSEASGVGRQRHGAGDEVAGARALHLAADPRRSGASECDAACDAARRT